MKRLALAALVATMAVSASAQDAVLIKISGPVSLRVGGAKRFSAAKGGEDLLYGDTIRVGKGGVAHLSLPDRGAVLLREETIMTLQGTSRRTTLNVRFGEFLIGLKKRLEPSCRTCPRTRSRAPPRPPRECESGRTAPDQGTAYAGFGHVVAVTAKGKTVLVEPGKTVTVAYGKAPADPVPSEVGFGYALNFAIDGSLQGLAELAETDKLRK